MLNFFFFFNMNAVKPEGDLYHDGDFCDLSSSKPFKWLL